MLAEVERAVQRHHLLVKGERVLVAVSGGVDSMVLLFTLKKLGYAVEAGHVDHGLRGESSDADRRLVLEQCARWKIPVHVEHVDPKAIDDDRSIQMAARDLRREALLAMADGCGIESIATAHHADDALETVLLNLMRGTGIKGWAGVPVRAGRIIRPMIELDRERIMAFAQERSIPYREDSSNTDPKYLRNRVRHELLPAMEALRSGAIATARRSNALLRSIMEVAAARLREQFTTELSEKEPIAIAAILDHEQPLLALTWVLRHHGLHPAMTERLLVAMENGDHGSRFLITDGTLILERERIVLVRGESAYGPFTVEGPEQLGAAPLLVSSAKGIDTAHGPQVAWLDVAAVPFPWTLRRWKAGDRLRPVGMTGTKLVSDILTDAKVDHATRRNALVLECGGRIAWLLGHRVDQAAAAMPGADKVWRVESVG